MKKVLSLCLVLLMVLSTGSLSAFAEEERPVITIGREASALLEDYDTNEFTRMLEESLGVEIKVEIYSEAASKLSLLVAGNAELPDIINFSLDDATIAKYGASGIFLPLNDYFADPELAVNFQKLDPAVQETILGGSRMADGNNYSMPLLGEFFPNYVCYHLMINKVWLEKLNLEIPKTTEELRAVLEAFAANDMNGNGLDDEIPMMGCTDGFGSNATAVLLNSFTKANPEKDYFYPENGVIKAAFLEDEFKEGLEYVRGLVADGLLDAATFTQTLDQFKAIINQEDAVVGVMAAGLWDVYFNKPADAPATWLYQWDHPVASQYVYMDYPVGPEGEQNIIYNPATPNQLFFITKDCDNPELAFKLGDLGYDPYNSLISRHGTEGENWTADPEVLKNYRGPVIDGVQLEPKWVLLKDPWGFAQNKHWLQQYPGYFSINFNLYCGASIDAKASYMELVYTLDSHKVPDEYIVKLTYTEEEQDELSFMKTAIDDYVKECMTAFVTGNMDIAKDWDRYIDELKAMDVDRYIEIVQAAYDRTK